jgi:cysteine desulfuration protein SufE
MSPEQKEQQLISRLSLIEDLQERMAAIVDRAKKLPPLSESERNDTFRVAGCVSRVWIIPTVEEGRCQFRLDADSTLVKGFAGLICEVYAGSTPAAAAQHETRILESLHLSDQLTPTRKNGLDQVQKTVRRFASTCIPFPPAAG